MEDFTPKNNYHPEDEYESLDIADKLTDALTDMPEQQIEPQPAPAQPIPPMQDPMQQEYQQAQPYINPPQQTPFYPAYPIPAQQPVQQPMQQPIQQPAQQPTQYTYPQPSVPIYSQPYQQPAYPQQIPATQAYAQVQNTQPFPTNPYAREHVQNPQPLPTNPYAQEQGQNGQPLPANPYVQEYNRQTEAPQIPAQPKSPTPTGTKVFIIILCALLAMMVVGFIIYIAASQGNKNYPTDTADSGFSVPEEDEGDSFEPAPFDGFVYSGNYTEIEDEITLKADNGETQKRDDDNASSVGKPNEKAKDITLNPLPKDKNDEKYNTQSAYTTVSDSVVTVVCYQSEITEDAQDIVSQGTGTIISADGYIITNAHVISNSRAYAVNIVLNNSDKYPAKIIGYDTWTDLAVLKIDAKNLKAVTFGDSSLIKIGDDVIAIGSPGGETFQNSLTKGIVSAVDRELAVNKNVRYIQSDAAINPGNSGGPLCNIYGQVIGITTAKVAAENYENMSFSIPSETVEEIVGDLMRYGYVKGRTRIGISGTEVSAEEIMYYNTPAGVIISVIDENGSLADTKIREGDIITELDGKAITSFQDIYDVLANHKPGDEVTIKVQRFSR